MYHDKLDKRISEKNRNDSLASIEESNDTLSYYQNMARNKGVIQFLAETVSGSSYTGSETAGFLPEDIIERCENMSGFSLDDVRVHYNSDKPQSVQALAYTDGNDIYISPGQEKYLAHEAWHIVQQMQGRVAPSGSENSLLINDDDSLEQEADDFLFGRSTDIAYGDSCSPASTANKKIIQKVLSFNTLIANNNNHRAISTIPMAQFFIEINANPANGFTAVFSPLIPVNTVRIIPGPPVLVEINVPANVDLIAFRNNFHASFINDPNNNLIPNYMQLLAPFDNMMQNYDNQEVVLGADLNPNGEIDLYDPADPNNSAYVAELINNLMAHFTLDVGAPMYPGGFVAANMNPLPPVVQAGFDAFDGMIDLNAGLPNLPNMQLPNVNIAQAFWPPGAFMTPGGTMHVGVGTGATQVSHELGHHLENNLNLPDFLTLHNFLRGRTRPALNGERDVGWSGDDQTHGTGYNAVLPDMEFMGSVSDFLFSRGNVVPYGIYNFMNLPFHNNIRDYFFHSSNSERISYATMYRQDAHPFDNSGSTEFLSTTAELLSDAVGRTALIQSDPLRVVLFLYLADRPFYTVLRQMMLTYAAANLPVPVAGINPWDLDNLIHTVQ